MTIDSLLKSAKLAYKGKQVNLVCETLLAHFLCKNRVFLHSHSHKKIQDILCESSTNLTFDSPQMLESEMFEAILRLNDGYPLEYLTKKVSFYSQEFFIECGALIPRPETELLVDKALQLIKVRDIKKIYEIGTGSGIVSIMLCLLNPSIKIIATDISPTALKIAQKNITLKSAMDSTLKSRILLVESDLLKSIDFNPKDSLIISNPPYIAEDYAIPCNLAYEPQNALFGGKNGDEILKEIIALNADCLCCEIGYNQGYLADFLTHYKRIEFYKDYAGFLRGFVAVK